MAKGNLFLGTAAKSVGDVVMYRREGAQVSRVRVRKIANPKTDAQCKQRAIMAPIPKFFSPLAIVLERSFEGLSKSKSYSKFLKVNADKARANDWLLTKGTGFYPLPYQLSSGSLKQLSDDYHANSVKIKLNIVGTNAETQTLGAISSDLVSEGYQNGDIVTIVFVLSNGTGTAFTPFSFQFEIDTTSVVTLSSLKVANTQLQGDNGDWGLYNADDQLAAGAIIISRWENDKWRRSTQEIVMDPNLISAISTDAAKAAAIASYRGTVDGGNPMVYLDGDELQ